MKVLVSLFVVAAAVASINATCSFCSKNEQVHQGIVFTHFYFILILYFTTLKKKKTNYKYVIICY